MTDASHSPSDRIEAAESIFTLLARLDVSRFPWEERIGVGVCQAKAMRQWIEAIRSAKAHLRFQRLFHRVAPVKRRKTDSRTPLSSFLVDRGHPNRQ
jgi:hypothetical protein